MEGPAAHIQEPAHHSAGATFLQLCTLSGESKTFYSAKFSPYGIQGVETARAMLTTTPQGQAADAQFVKWLMDHQKEAGVFTTVSGLVEQLTDNPAAKMTAQEIAQRVQQAQQQRTAVAA